MILIVCPVQVPYQIAKKRILNLRMQKVSKLPANDVKVCILLTALVRLNQILNPWGIFRYLGVNTRIVRCCAPDSPTYYASQNWFVIRSIANERSPWISLRTKPISSILKPILMCMSYLTGVRIASSCAEHFWVDRIFGSEKFSAFPIAEHRNVSSFELIWHNKGIYFLVAPSTDNAWSWRKH